MSRSRDPSDARSHRPSIVAPPAAVTLAQSVTDRLRAALLSSEFVPEEKLNEEALATMLAVSRTPVRAALHSLATQGLLDYVPNRGYSVRSMDARRLSSIFDVRGVLEGLAARLAAQNGMTDDQEQVFQAALAAGDLIVAKGRLLPEDLDPYSDINARIHRTIVDAADNRMLNDMLDLCDAIPALSDHNVLWNDYAWLRRSHDDHHRLLEAIRQRDAWRAESLMREHVHSVKLQSKSMLPDHAPKRTPAT